MNEVDKIKKFILELSGNKIITIMTMNGLKKFDVDNNGEIGYHETHPDIFNQWINDSISSVGSIMVRQFTNIESHKIDGDISVPYKNIYGFVCVDGKLRALNKVELEKSFSVDYKTNRPIDLERGVLFCIAKKWEHSNRS